MPRPTWDEYFIKIATDAASRSTCLRVPEGVGAVLVKDHQILATGYAGSFRGQPHCTDVGCLIDPVTKGCKRTVHAECNTILQAAQHGVNINGSTVYCTMSPCWDCFKMLVNGGIVRIVYDVEYRTVDLQKEFAKNLGIGFDHVSDKKYTGVPCATIMQSKSVPCLPATIEFVPISTVPYNCSGSRVLTGKFDLSKIFSDTDSPKSEAECPDCSKYTVHCPTCHKDLLK